MSSEAYDWFTLSKGESTQSSIFNGVFVYLVVHAQFDKQEIEIMNIFWFLLVFSISIMIF